MATNEETPKKEQEQTPDKGKGQTGGKKPRKPRERKEGAINLVGKKPEDQIDILVPEIAKRKEEIEKLNEKIKILQAEIKDFEKKLDRANDKLLEYDILKMGIEKVEKVIENIKKGKPKIKN